MDGQGPMPFDTAGPSPHGDDVLVEIMFDVERFLVPADKIAAQRDNVWKHVDELRISPAQIAYLAKNGFRMGIADRTQISALRQVLDSLGARSEHVNQTVQNGYPLTLDFGTTGRNRTVFTFRRDGRIVGQTFDTAAQYLHIDYRVDVIDHTPRTTLRITPEMFQESRRPQWQESDGQVRYEKQYQGIVYHELATELPTAPGETLIVGPANAEDYRFILGSTILSNETAGRCWETMLCITPRVYRTQGPKGFE